MDNGVEILRKCQIDTQGWDPVRRSWAATHIPEKLGMTHVRFKDCKNEHDDEEEDIGCQNRHLVDALYGFFTDVFSVWKKKKHKQTGN